jgi:hypothetical protein
MIGSAASAATEIADTRCWNTLPAQIRMARLPVAVGEPTVKVTFKNAQGLEVGSHTFPPVKVEKGKKVFLNYRTSI